MLSSYDSVPEGVVILYLPGSVTPEKSPVALTSPEAGFTLPSPFTSPEKTSSPVSAFTTANVASVSGRSAKTAVFALSGR